MIKPSDIGVLDSVVDSVTKKFRIRDKTLRLFIQPQVRKINPRLRQICGCEIFIIPKDVQIDLNRFIKNIVIDLQQKYVGRQTCNSEFSTISAANYKYKLFPDGGCLHATI